MGFIGDALGSVAGSIIPGVGNVLFGDGGQAPQPFRAPGYEQQGQFLNDYLIKQAQQANPYQSFTPGQAIGGQIGPTIKEAQQLNPYLNFGNVPELQFQKRNPFQFQSPQQGFQYNLTPFNAQQAVQDAFTPQAQNVQNILNRQGALQDMAIKEDLNRRGLLTSGATTQALGERQRSTNDALASALAGLAGTQAGAQLQASQFGTQSQLAQQQAQQAQDYARQQQEFQRQLSQAEEIFRQQGATDQQAAQMAQNALQKQAQSLAAQGQQFNQQLQGNNFGLTQQQALFNQLLQGRQQGLQEFGIQNQIQNQPIQDLLRLFGYSTGSNPGMAPTPGLLQGLAGGAGQGAGMALGAAAFCLPKGTEIQTIDGSIKVEDLKVGDQVNGGKVIATIRKLRPEGHFFSKHTFAKGEVVMTLGHPSFDKVLDHEPVKNDFDSTYDILTETGYYYVNGVKLGSTLGGNYGV